MRMKATAVPPARWESRKDSNPCRQRRATVPWLFRPAIRAVRRPAGERAYSGPQAESGSLNWQPLDLAAAAQPAPNALLTWFRFKFECPSRNSNVWVPWHLHVEAEGNGFVYLNGHCLGRYWQIGPQRDFYMPESWLHFRFGAIERGGAKPSTIGQRRKPSGGVGSAGDAIRGKALKREFRGFGPTGLASAPAAPIARG